MKVCFLIFLLILPIMAQGQNFVHYEARQTHPIALTPDGQTLLAVNSLEGRLSVFTISAAGPPILVAEIPTGIEPVSVKARNNQEAWVVNEVSDTVSVVSLTEMRVLATLQADDEPSDVHFAQGRAFVSCARNRMVRVFDPQTRMALGTIPLQGVQPGAMASSADGTRLYVSFLLSGNRTTVLPPNTNRSQPNPTNAALPAPPKTALIVPASDSRVNYTVLDRDVAEIDTQSLAVVRYLSDVGTNLFDLQTHPLTGDLWVVNSDASNLIAFEPNLKGHFAFHRLSCVALGEGASPVHHDLNSGVNFTLPATPTIMQNALAQPTALAFDATGTHAWIAAFNSDRVAKVEVATGNVVARIDMRTGPDSSSAAMRGTRGIVLHSSQPFAYAYHKFSQTITTIRTDTGAILAETMASAFHPMPLAQQRGRGFFYDARLSSHGTVSCATCHIDADRDGLAWDLGDPGGAMLTVKGSALSAHDTRVRDRVLHPMKGPMVTQTLRGMATNTTSVTTPAASVTTKFHWRGDMPSIQAFNSTFPNLLGGSLIPAADMENLTTYLLAIRHHPNPNRNFDRSLKTALEGGNPVTGRDLFNDHLASHCATCHALSSGTDQNIDLMTEAGTIQPVKNPPLRTVYQRANLFNNGAGATSVAGFGLGHDGTRFALPKVHPYVLDELSVAQLVHVTAFILSFDTATAPVAAGSMLVNIGNRGSMAANLVIMENAPAADGDLVVHAEIGGKKSAFFWNKTLKRYQSATSAVASLTQDQLFQLLGPNDSLLFVGTPAGQGMRASIDRDGDTIPDGLEPLPALTLEALRGQQVRLSWPIAEAGWLLERSVSSGQVWEAEQSARAEQGGIYQVVKPALLPREFFRLKRTW